MINADPDPDRAFFLIADPDQDPDQSSGSRVLTFADQNLKRFKAEKIYIYF